MVPGVPDPKIVKQRFEPARTLELVQRVGGVGDTGYRGGLAPIATAPELYVPLLGELPLGDLQLIAPKTHGVGLRRTGIKWQDALGALFLIGMLFGLPAVWLAQPKMPWFVWLIAVPFVLLALLAVYVSLQRVVSRLRRISVDLDQPMYFLGDELVARVSTATSLRNFQAQLTCVESAKVMTKDGPAVQTSVRWSGTMQLVGHERRGKATISTLTQRVPLEGPASFEDDECSLRWFVKIETTSGSLDETFPFQAVPRVRA